MASRGFGSENGMSPRKSMAMGKTAMGSEKFGVTPGLYDAGTHPDAKLSHNPLDDGDRGRGTSAKGMPNHGPTRIRGRRMS